MAPHKPQFLDAIRKFRSEGTSLKMNLALSTFVEKFGDKPPPERVGHSLSAG